MTRSSLRLNRQLWLPLLLLVLLGVIPVVHAQESSDDPITRIDTFLTQLADSDLFSGAVLVARGDEVLLNEGYNMANREWNVPNTPDSKFRIGSITKHFTAMGILILQEQGLLSVQDPICDYIEDCPEAWADITIHHLLTHTSGVHELFAIPEFAERVTLPTTPAQTIALFRDLPLDFAPGESWSYSNSGYILLGEILKAASGESYIVFLREHIFDPLELDGTGYDDPNRVLKNRAAGYIDSLRNATYVNMTVPYSAGGLYSTTGDLHRWIRGLFTGQVMSMETLQTSFDTPVEVTNAPAGAIAQYGYGTIIGEYFGHQVVGHNGSINGFTSSLNYFPEDEVTLVVLSNFEAIPMDQILQNSIRMIFNVE